MKTIDQAYRESWRKKSCEKSSWLSKSATIRLSYTNKTKNSKFSTTKSRMRNNSEKPTSKTTNLPPNPMLQLRNCLSAVIQKEKSASGIWYLRVRRALMRCSMEMPATESSPSNSSAPPQMGSISKRLSSSPIPRSLSQDTKPHISLRPKNSQHPA